MAFYPQICSSIGCTTHMRILKTHIYWWVNSLGALKKRTSYMNLVMSTWSHGLKLMIKYRMRRGIYQKGIHWMLLRNSLIRKQFCDKRSLVWLSTTRFGNCFLASVVPNLAYGSDTLFEDILPNLVAQKHSGELAFITEFLPIMTYYSSIQSYLPIYSTT